MEASYLFPGGKGKEASELISDFSKVLANFSGEGKEGLPPQTYRYAAESLLSTMQHFLGNVALGGNGISLYDYARLNAALVSCLSQMETHEGEGEPPFFLLKGDFGGIQSFIFDVNSKGVAKSLKARSLRVQLLEILASRYILEQLDLSPANLLHIGGGNFYILALGIHQEHIRQLQSKILTGQLENELAKHEGFVPFPDSLSLYLGGVEVPQAAIANKFGKYWQSVDLSLSRHRPTAYQGIEEELLFNPIPPISQTLRRDVEKAFYKDQAKELNSYEGFSFHGNKNADWKESYVVGSANVSEDLEYTRGKQMGHPYSLGGKHVELVLKENRKKAMDLLAHSYTLINDHKFGIRYEDQLHIFPQPFIFLVRKLPLWRSPLLPLPQVRLEEVNQAIEAPDWENLDSPSRQKANMREIILQYLKHVHETQADEEDKAPPRTSHIINFAYLGLMAKQRTGTDRLGILKMDVDDLGKLFQKKMQGERNSMGHVAALSRSLKWFFEGYMNALLDTKLTEGISAENTYYYKVLERHSPLETFRDNLYVVFSGGDDFFVIGAWDIVMEFADIVQEKFHHFTGGAATLSAGLVLLPSRHPINKMVELADEALGEAKGYVRKLGPLYKEQKGLDTYYPKNRISVMGQVLTWGDFREAKAIRDTLYFLVTKAEHREPKAIIHRVRKSFSGFEKIQQEVLLKRKISLPRLWRLHYYLRQVKEENQLTVQRHIIERYDSLFHKLLHHRHTPESQIPANPGLIGVGARWAELLSRREPIEQAKSTTHV